MGWVDDVFDGRRSIEQVENERIAAEEELACQVSEQAPLAWQRLVHAIEADLEDFNRRSVHRVPHAGTLFISVNNNGEPCLVVGKSPSFMRSITYAEASERLLQPVLFPDSNGSQGVREYGAPIQPGQWLV